MPAVYETKHSDNCKNLKKNQKVLLLKII